MSLRSLACLLLACAASLAHAQPWPARPIRMIVPWFGVFGPPGLQRAVADRIDTELNRILRDPAIKERFHTLGFEITGGHGTDLAAIMQSEARKWSKVTKDANVKAE